VSSRYLVAQRSECWQLGRGPYTDIGAILSKAEDGAASATAWLSRYDSWVDIHQLGINVPGDPRTWGVWLVKEPQSGRRAEPAVAAPQSTTYSGIEVREERMATVTVRAVYEMHCECGRFWFELELPKFVKCPACHKLGLVFLTDPTHKG